MRRVTGTRWGGNQVDLIGQGKYDVVAGTAHLGILASLETLGFALDFLTNPSSRR